MDQEHDIFVADEAEASQANGARLSVLGQFVGAALLGIAVGMVLLLVAG